MDQIIHSRLKDYAGNLIKEFMGGSSCPDPDEAIKDVIIYIGYDSKLNKALHFKRIINLLFSIFTIKFFKL